MQSNVHSPFYFSGLESGATEQWALLDPNKNILLVDQDFKLIKFLELLLQKPLSLVDISTLSNYYPLDNIKCLMLAVHEDRIVLKKITEQKLLMQQKLFYVRSIISFIKRETEFFAQHREDENKKLHQTLSVEKEFFCWTRPNDSNLQKLYDIELDLLNSYKIELDKVRSNVLNVLINLDFEKELKSQVLDKINSLELHSQYFDYIKHKFNAVYGSI